MLERELDLQFFHNNGWKRYRCKKCGSYFWSREDRDTCSEAPCGQYEFLNEPIFDREYSIEDMRRAFIDFFKRRGHTPISRYPVVARWRDDVFLVNASIYDFQPHVTSGLAPPPANPLVISQACIRMVDVDAVGKTGRHLTGFEMMAHHAFNYPDEWVYWKDETVEYALKLIEELGGNPDKVVFKEHPWIGGGNAGASFEVIYGGLELATLVFMNLKEDENGDVEIEGVGYSEMPVKVVDTGYGLERFVWASKGTPTIYDAIYPEMVNELMGRVGLERNERRDFILKQFALISPRIEIEDEHTLVNEVLKTTDATIHEYKRFILPLQKIYAVADYTRSLAFMLTDGIVPSNVQAGYLARLLIRRVLKLLDDLGNPASIGELVEMHVNRFADIMDSSMLSIVLEELELEEKRYRKTLSKGMDIVRRHVKKKGKIDVEDLVLFYDSHGLLPDIVKDVARELGVKVEIPKDFHRIVAKRHEGKKRLKKDKKSYPLPPTKKLYYENPYLREFDAKVIYSKNGEIVLDSTAFYPEGGGQPCDLGYLEHEGKRYMVRNVRKYDEVVVHFIEGDIPEGVNVRGFIDWERRERLMRNHTAEHVLLAASRRVLGKHVWQHGTQKDVHECRFDIAHYKPITREEIKKIEEEAMRIITSCVPVEARFMDRTEAEKKYGFVLYEGGIPPGRKIRVVKIGDFDVEACGGTHVSNTGEIGFLKILRTERIQDGVSRIIYTSGISALEHTQSIEDMLQSSADILGVQPERLPEAVDRFFREWKEQRKIIEKLRREQTESLRKELEKRDVLAEILPLEMKDLGILARELLDKGGRGVLIGEDGSFVVFGPGARELVREIAGAMDGKGGGKDNFAQGRGKREKIRQGLNRARELLGLK